MDLTTQQSYIAVDEDGDTHVFSEAPTRNTETNVWSGSSSIKVPTSTAYKLTGRNLSWSDDKVKLVESLSKEQQVSVLEEVIKGLETGKFDSICSAVTTILEKKKYGKNIPCADVQMHIPPINRENAHWLSWKYQIEPPRCGTLFWWSLGDREPRIKFLKAILTEMNRI